MALLVRSWNVFHGNTSPPRRRSFLREMVELAAADGPDVLCLQEVPVWALGRLGGWSGMRAFPAVARRGMRPAAVAGWVTRLHNGVLRSALAGQANAILVRSGHAADDLGSEQLSEPGVERRVCQAVRVDGDVVVANTHLSSAGRGQPAELARFRAFAEARARPGETVVLAGDLNLTAPVLEGYSPPAVGIDQVLVRGAVGAPAAVWPAARRRRDGVSLSDHAPVEAVVG
jgi:endonuclease/exonuclease/phosphatase family metal-dependent hydrolase